MLATVGAKPPSAFARHIERAGRHAHEAGALAVPAGLRFDLVTRAVSAARQARSAATLALSRTVDSTSAYTLARDGRDKVSAGLNELSPFARQEFHYPDVPQGLDRALHAANSHFRLADYLFHDSLAAAG